uniref:Uncharacterized protein n=1 Tax=Anopheles culicifacies TaxID=139723 RepID=A0A182LYG4_9DIPT
MQFKHYTLACFVLIALWAVPTPAEVVIQHIDIPNRIAWLPEGTDLVLSFLIRLTDNMIEHYSLALKRIKHLRETIQSYPPAYDSVDMFYDNDIQQPLEKDKLKPTVGGSGYAKDAFQSALRTVQQFAGKRVPPFGKH